MGTGAVRQQSHRVLAGSRGRRVSASVRDAAAGADEVLRESHAPEVLW